MSSDSFAVVRHSIRAINRAAIDAHLVLHAIGKLGHKVNTVLWQKPLQIYPWQIVMDKFVEIHALKESIDQKIKGYAWIIGKVTAYAEFLERDDIAFCGDEQQNATLRAAATDMREAIPSLREYAIKSLHVSSEAVDDEIARSTEAFRQAFGVIKPAEMKARPWSGWVRRIRNSLGIGPLQMPPMITADGDTIPDAVWGCTPDELHAAREQTSTLIHMTPEKWDRYCSTVLRYAEAIGSDKMATCLNAMVEHFRQTSPDKFPVEELETNSARMAEQNGLTEEQRNRLEIILRVAISTTLRGRPNPRLTSERARD